MTTQSIGSDTKWWILDAVGHRKADNEAPRPETTTFLGHEVPVIYTDTDWPLDMWACDVCNGDITIAVEGKPQFVPMQGSYALCQRCLFEQLSEDERVAFLAGAWKPVQWSQFTCDCTACKTFAETPREGT